MYIISACLLGENCKYDGGNNSCEWVKKFAEQHKYICVCPETLGGLTAPRPPVELIGGRAVNTEGRDVTPEFERGREIVYEMIMRAESDFGERAEGAILKARSPSCGSGEIYDGTFSHTIIEGDGFLTTLLKEKGINVITEEEKDYDKL